MTAIGKRRDSAPKRKRRESGLRERAAGADDDEGDPPASEADAGLAHGLAHGLPDRRGGDPLPSLDAVDLVIGQDADVIARLLEQTSERLLHMTDSPLRRELGLVVERYARALREWQAQAPTPVQRVILIDCVRALHARVVSRTRPRPGGETP